MTTIYPMLFKPIYKNSIWGGRSLEKIGRELPDTGPIGESWEVSSHKDGMTPIINGEFAGKSLQDVLTILGEDLLGSNNQWALNVNKFPWMVRLVDARQNLSLQTHPGDAYALENVGDELGKYEMWIVLDADPDASVILGLNEKITRNEIEKTISDGSIEKYLNRLNVQQGDHICVPAGTLHAIQKGSVIVEIHETSNTTYRLYDWKRLDADGKLRPLQVEQALDTLDFDKVNCELPQAKILKETEDMVVDKLCRNVYFTVERYQTKKPVNFSGECDGTTVEIWGVIEGEAEIAGQSLSAVQFAVLPAKLGPYDVVASENSILLRTYQPVPGKLMI